MRSHVWAELRRRAYDIKHMNDDNRQITAEAIFAVENDLEHRRGHLDKNVVEMRTARNFVYDDLGWNEYILDSGAAVAA